MTGRLVQFSRKGSPD